MSRYPTLPFVPTAVALGHLLGYAVAHPEAAARAEALAGHGHLPIVLALGVLSGLVGLTSAVRARSTDRGLAPRYGRLVQLGALGFWGLELAERALHGELAAAVAEPAVWCGLVLQAAIAAQLVALARSAAHLGVRLAPRRSTATRTRSVSRRWLQGRPVPPSGIGHVPPNRRRGPPLLAA